MNFLSIQKMAETGEYLQVLPRDILGEVLLHLDFDSILNLCSTNYSYFRLCQGSTFWGRYLRLKYPHLNLSDPDLFPWYFNIAKALNSRGSWVRVKDFNRTATGIFHAYFYVEGLIVGFIALMNILGMLDKISPHGPPTLFDRRLQVISKGFIIDSAGDESSRADFTISAFCYINFKPSESTVKTVRVQEGSLGVIHEVWFKRWDPQLFEGFKWILNWYGYTVID